MDCDLLAHPKLELPTRGSWHISNQAGGYLALEYSRIASRETQNQQLQNSIHTELLIEKRSPENPINHSCRGKYESLYDLDKPLGPLAKSNVMKGLRLLLK
jgi:hypothetical protein